MGPVSFDRLGDGLSRQQLLAVAGKLATAGIRVQLIDHDRAMLIRGDDMPRARAILAELKPESQDDDPAEKSSNETKTAPDATE